MTRVMRRFLTGLAATGTICSVSVLPDGISVNRVGAQDHSPAFKLQREASLQADNRAADPEEEKNVRLYFFTSSWNKVLDKVAESTGSTLVATRFPSGTFSRQDFRKYTRKEAVRLLNKELEQIEFRLLEQGKYLVLVHLPTTRPRYQRPIIAPTIDSMPDRISEIGTQRRSPFQRRATKIRPDSPKHGEPRRLHDQSTGIRQAGFQEEDSPKPEQEKTAQKSFKPKSRTARALASALYDAFKERAKTVEEGVEGLPSMQVFGPKTEDGTEPQIVFSMGVDIRTNELLVEGPQVQVDRVLRLLAMLDVKPKVDGESTKVVTTEKNAKDVADKLNPAIRKMVDRNDGKAPQDATEGKGESLPDIVGGIRGDVKVEAMEALGALIITGNSADVDAVMQIVRQIEELSARTAPDVHLRILQNVDSEALTELLTSVYDQLNEARGNTQTQAQQISIIAVGRPNSVLILASPADLESILALIDKLDTPIEKDTSFMVFKLKHTIAPLLQEMMEDFYADRGGLETRAQVATDVRTNSLIVLARPNDLNEIKQLIAELDVTTSDSVAVVKVYELKHSSAEELAGTINQIVQAVLNPPQLGQGQLGQAFLGFGGGNASQALREVRSVILEYLVGEGEEKRMVRSGILADIRINSDPRSNTLIVTAPKESLELVAELIRRLDKAATSVATIKHFALKYADANLVRDMLDNLFGQTATAQSTAGVQIAGADDASSVVPLRFEIDVRTNSIVAFGTAEALEVVGALLYRLDESDIRRRRTAVVRLKNTEAEAVAAAINEFIDARRDLATSSNGLVSTPELFDRDVIVVPEQAFTNSLLISASPRYFEELQEMVLSLDQAPRQVMIQALIVEVALENTDELGVEIGIQDPVLFDRSVTLAEDLLTIADTNTSPNGVQTTTQRIISQAATPGFGFNSPNIGNNIAGHPGRAAAQGLSSFSVGRVNEELGFGGLVLSAGSESVNVLIRALSACRRVEILSRPQILTLDNQTATISVAAQIPRVNGFQPNQATGIATPNVEQVNAGITLTVTPRISPDGKIIMQVDAEKTALSGQTVALTTNIDGTAVESPIIEGATANAWVSVDDEQTVVLGGMITKETNSLTRKVPWLGDIPLIGQAFRFDSESIERKELLIFLTPRVIKSAQYSEMLKQIEAQRTHFTESEAEEIHGPIYAVPPSMDGPIEIPEPISEPAPAPAPGDDFGVPTTNIPANSRLRRVGGGLSDPRIQQADFQQPANRQSGRSAVTTPPKPKRKSFLRSGLFGN